MSLRILIVDNDQANIDFIGYLLKAYGYEAVSATNMDKALELLSRERPDLIVSDLNLPGRSGFDLIQAVKADPSLAAIPFVFLSSTSWESKDIDRALRMGASKFLRRPIEAQVLLTEIETILGTAKKEP